MMGDNRTQSCDSRRWGTVPRGNLIGPVFAIYWPPNRLHVASRGSVRASCDPLRIGAVVHVRALR